MIDTHPSIQLRFEQMMMSRTPIERLRMGASMFDTAKKIVCDSILSQEPKISLKELKKELFLRFYGQELGPAQVKRFLKSL